MRIFHLDATPDQFIVSLGKKARHALPASIETLYALEQAVPEEDLTEGVTLHVSRALLSTPLGLEAFKHCVYLNTVYYTYPRISSKAPARGGAVKATDFEHHVNSLKNLPTYHRLLHVTNLTQAAKNSLGIIIQPGPSLNLEFITSVRDKAVLVAIGRTLPELLGYGIVPDVIYQQDTSRHSWETSYGCLEGRRIDSALVANPVSPFHAFGDRFLNIYKSWNFYPFETDQMPFVMDSISPSTTTGAFSLALHLGCNPIIFHGGDFGSVVTPQEPLSGLGVDGYPCEDAGDVLTFPPQDHLHFGFLVQREGKLPAATSSDYLAASQWIKRTALQVHTALPGHRFYDHSSTELLTENSVIKPYRHEVLEGRVKHFELRRYQARFPWRDHANEQLRHFRSIRRILASSGQAPQSSLGHAFNALYSGFDTFRETPFPLSPDELHLALERADELIAVLEDILATA